MPTRERKEPSHDDNYILLFGRHQETPLIDVPASYLLWLWNQGYSNDIRLVNYIYNNITALHQECPDTIIDKTRNGYPL